MSRNIFAIGIALGLAAQSAPASAHPHVFVDAEIRFVLRDGLLDAVQVGWMFDPLYSLLVLEEMGLDPAAPLDAAGAAVLAALQPQWAAEFGGEGSLAVDGEDRPLRPARAFAAAMEEGRLVLRFERPLEAPLDPRGAAVLAAIYDPGYFVAYFLTDSPGVDGDPGCTAIAMPFEADAALGSLQTALLGLGMEESPADPMIGRLFADRARLACG